MPAWARNEMRFSEAEPRLHTDWGATYLHRRRKPSFGSASEVCQPDVKVAVILRWFPPVSAPGAVCKIRGFTETAHFLKLKHEAENGTN